MHTCEYLGTHTVFTELVSAYAALRETLRHDRQPVYCPPRKRLAEQYLNLVLFELGQPTSRIG